MEHNENTGAPQSDAQDSTQEFPAYQPPPPAGHSPGPPQWATPPAAGRSRSQNRVLVGLAIAMSLVLIIVVPAAVIGLTPVGDWIGIEDDDGDNARTVVVAQAQAPAAQAPAPAEAPADGTDLRNGAVYVQSNDAKSNEVVAFARNADGTLKEVGRYKTGGTGSGSVEDNANSVVLGSSDAEVAPNHNSNKADLLFVTNAGSNTVSVFRIKADGLELASVTPSGGEKPLSVTVNKGLVYVLNGGEFDDRFVVGATEILENCTSGQLPSVTGFKVTPDGVLTQIHGSTQLLSGERDSGCAQLSFTPDGRILIATERIAGSIDEAGVAKGAFITWLVRADGTLANKQVITPTGNGPFAFTFTKDGTMLVAQQNGGAAAEGAGQVMSYSVNEDGSLAPIGDPVGIGGTDTCWIVVTDNGRLAFATSPFGGGVISALSVGKDGRLGVLHYAASADNGQDPNADHIGIGVLDLSLTHDSKFIYTIEILNGIVYGFRVNDNGTLALVDQKQVFSLRSLDMGGEGGPFGIAAY